MPRLAWAIALLGAATTALAKTVTYNFNVSWVTANPDGLFERKVVGINGQWPLPVIEVDKGDRLVVNMYNGLGDKDASIHFHGMFQNGTNEMDGANMVTQCPIPPGSSFTYDFTVNQNGTYWYHCHTDYCYPDGYRQALIVHDSHAPFEFDDEFTITLSDWYHDMLEDLSHGFMSVYNPTGAEPIPDSFLFNDTLNTKIPVQPNSTYLLRLINHGAFVAQYFYIEGHTFEIVEVDGVYTEPAEAEILYIAIAQRYSVLLKTKNTTDANFAIVTVADTQLLDTITPNLQLNNTNWLEYDSHADYPQASINVSQASDLNPFDDITLVPYDRMPLLPEPDYRINVTVYMNNLITGYNYAFLNDITYTPPKVPSVYTALSSGNLSANPAIYGEYTQPMVLRHNDVVEVILNNGDSGSHPFHLHGHNFQLITRAPPYGPHFYDYLNGDPVGYDPNNHTAFPAIPVRRDTAVLPPQGYYVIRFVADNPGVWLFHCHIDWHMSSGLAMIMVEAPELMPERMSIPEDHYDACRKAGVAYEGNAAGNAEDFLDLSRQNVQPGFIPGGFTARGIVALVFSVVSAVLGIVSIVVYGLADINPKHKHHAAAPAVSEPGGGSADHAYEVVGQTVNSEKKD